MPFPIWFELHWEKNAIWFSGTFEIQVTQPYASPEITGHWKKFKRLEKYLRDGNSWEKAKVNRSRATLCKLKVCCLQVTSSKPKNRVRSNKKTTRPSLRANYHHYIDHLLHRLIIILMGDLRDQLLGKFFFSSSTASKLPLHCKIQHLLFLPEAKLCQSFLQAGN